MDDTTRRVGTGDDYPDRGNELRGRGEDQVRDYASTTPSGTTSSATSSVTSRTTGSAGDADLDEDSSRRARELESEIAHTRAEMSETIEAIQEKLRPANLVSDATEKVKSATTEKVKNMADTASETAQDVMRGSRERAYDMVEGAKQNPIPALMIGAGVAWLLMSSRNRGDQYGGSSTWSRSRTSRGAYSGGEDYYRSTEADYGDVDRPSGYDRQYSGNTQYSGSQSQYSGSGRYGESSQYGYGSEGWTGNTSRALSDATDTARQTVRRTSNQLQRMLHENPLLVGAAAVLAGAAIGASLPETERENQLMGEARDSVVDRAQEMARDAKDTVKEAASDPLAAVSKVAEVVNDKK